MHFKRRLLFICGLYLLMLPAFGLAYHLFYKSDRSSFAFNADVVIAQAEQMKRGIGQQIAENDRLLRVVDALLLPAVTFRVPDGGADALDLELLTTIEASSGLILTVHDAIFSGENTMLTVYGSAHLLLAQFAIDTASQFLKTSEDVRTLLQRVRSDVIAESQRIRESRERLNLPHAEIWSYLDFLYFSTITQTTVGYGDILPNRTAVRMTVSAQILAATLLLAVALNWTLSST